MSQPSQPHEPAPPGDATAPPTGSLAAQFMVTFQKTIRSSALYARNNQLLTRFQAECFTLYGALTRERPELDFSVRADRLLLDGEVVLQDADRENGLPFRLFREGIRRLTLLAGMDAEELQALMGILGSTTTRGASFDDDVVTLLWKAALPHVKYVTVDISSAAYTPAGGPASSEADDGEQEIRQELDGLLAAIYRSGQDQASAEVRGLSISTDDLLALKALGDSRDAEVAQLGHTTERQIFPVPPDAMERLRQELAAETDQQLSDRSLDVLLAVLFSVSSNDDVRAVFEQLVSLYDSLLVSRDFRGAAGFIDRIRSFDVGDASNPSALRNRAMVRQLCKVFTNEQRMTAVTAALNEFQQVGVADFARLLAAVGRDDPSVLLQLLPAAQNPAHRKLVCDVMLGIGLPPVSTLGAVLKSSEWFVGRDILYLLSTSEDSEASSIILEAARAPHPRLRQAALAMLGHFPKGEADKCILQALQDNDPQIRQTAVRLAGQRGLKEAGDMMRAVVLHPDFGDRELAEIRSYLMAYALLCGNEAVPTLDRILNPPIMQKGMALLDRLKTSASAATDAQKVDLRIAAASALGAVNTPDAIASLQKATRSVIPGVKAASLKALNRGVDPTEGKA